jgi:hypothetical protein
VRLAPALILVLAARALAAGGDPGQDGPPPAAPAFYSVAISRIRNIAGDSFEFEREDRKIVKARLHDADCAVLGGSAIASAKAVATNLLEAQPVWIFPCGQVKTSEGSELWVCVWTAKGWLGDLLIRAGYARRRAGPEGVTLEPPEVYLWTFEGND